MTGRGISLALVAAAGSAALLLGALAFQYLGGLAPCQMCIWQRWPHVVAVGLGLLCVALPARGLAWLGAIVMLGSAGLAAYHVGVEQQLWLGPSTCGGMDITDMSPEDALNLLIATEPVPCDKIAWSLLGISMAGWNALASLACAGIWATAARR